MATVGYGDTFPISTQGRIVGTALMIMGVALLGTITASTASNFNMTNSEDKTDHTGSTKATESLSKVQSDLEKLQKRMTELENKLDN